MSKTRHAWWFAQMASVIPHTSVYATADGREVLVTHVTDTPTQNTDWPDMVYLGEVTHWLRHGWKMAPQTGRMT